MNNSEPSLSVPIRTEVHFFKDWEYPGRDIFYCHRRVKTIFAGFFQILTIVFLSEFVDFICKYIIIRIIGFPIVHPELRFQLHIVIQVTDCFPGIQKGRQAVKKGGIIFSGRIALS